MKKNSPRQHPCLDFFHFFFLPVRPATRDFYLFAASKPYIVSRHVWPLALGCNAPQLAPQCSLCSQCFVPSTPPPHIFFFVRSWHPCSPFHAQERASVSLCPPLPPLPPCAALQTLERFEGAGANRIYLTVAVMQMDQYLARASVSEMGELYALAGACMLLTSKFVGTRALHAASLAEFMFQPDAERLLAMETQVLTVLRWRLQMPTPHDFIKIFSDNLQLYLPQRPDTNAALVESACAIADICCSGKRKKAQKRERETGRRKGSVTLSPRGAPRPGHACVS